MAEVLVGKAKMADLNWIIKPEKRESQAVPGRPSRYYLLCTSISDYPGVAPQNSRKYTFRCDDCFLLSS